MKMLREVLVWVFVLLVPLAGVLSKSTGSSLELPLLPTTLTSTAGAITTDLSGQHDVGGKKKKIPRNLWIAMISAIQPAPHLSELYARNKLWKRHICDVKCRDEFINSVFRGTSVQWAYSIINPAAGSARIDIWKYAVLYIHGGVAMDDDSDIATLLDKIIQPIDSAILSEGGRTEVSSSALGEQCYVPSYHLSNQWVYTKYAANVSQSTYYTTTTARTTTDTAAMATNNPSSALQFFPHAGSNNMLATWAIFAMPRHPLLLHTLRNIVEITHAEYTRRSVIYLSRYDSRMKLYKCATQFVLTYTLRELALEGGKEEEEEEFKKEYPQPRVVVDNFAVYRGRTDIIAVAAAAPSSQDGIGGSTSTTTATAASTAIAGATTAVTAATATTAGAATATTSATVNNIGGGGDVLRGSSSLLSLLLPHLLREHSAGTVDSLLDRLDGRTVMSDSSSGKSIYLIINGTKRAFPDFDTYQRMKFSGNQVKYLRDSLLDKIPSGPALPSLMDASDAAVAASPWLKYATATSVAFSSNGRSNALSSSPLMPAVTATGPGSTASASGAALSDLRLKVDKKGIGCWGDDYTGSRDDFLNNRFKDILGEVPAMVYPLCIRLFQLGNTLGYYFNDIACADISGAHFFGVGKHFTLIEPEQLATSPEHHFAFFNALPDLIIHPQAGASVETVKQNMKRDCQCLQYCWENSVAPWLKRPYLIKRYLLPAIDAYIYAANAVSVGTLLSNSTDLSTEPMTSFLPLIPHAAIQYRCGDNIGFGKTNYGLLPFYGITARIPQWARYIYVMADSPTRQKHHTYSGRCGVILEALFDFLRKKFPHAVVVVKRGGDQFLDYARLAYANVTICSASTFCLWPAMSNSGAAYFPLTPLVGKSGSNATTKYLGPNFHWIREVEIIKEFKHFRPWTSILQVLEGRS